MENEGLLSKCTSAQCPALEVQEDFSGPQNKVAPCFSNKTGLVYANSVSLWVQIQQVLHGLVAVFRGMVATGGGGWRLYC